MLARTIAVLLVVSLVLAASSSGQERKTDGPPDAVDPKLIVRERYSMDPPHFSKDPAVKVDYDIVYVRAPHDKFIWPDVGAPTLVEPGADLMLLRPDSSQELLV